METVKKSPRKSPKKRKFLSECAITRKKVEDLETVIQSLKELQVEKDVIQKDIKDLKKNIGDLQTKNETIQLYAKFVDYVQQLYDYISIQMNIEWSALSLHLRKEASDYNKMASPKPSDHWHCSLHSKLKEQLKLLELTEEYWNTSVLFSQRLYRPFHSLRDDQLHNDSTPELDAIFVKMTTVFSEREKKVVFGVTALLPLITSAIGGLVREQPTTLLSKERSDGSGPEVLVIGFIEQVGYLWQTVKEPTILSPTLFIFLWQATPTSDTTIFFVKERSWTPFDSRELFYSFHRDEVPVESVMHKCVVHFIPSQKQPPRRTEHPGFIIRQVYDTVEKKQWKLTDKDYEDSKQKEIDLLVQKTKEALGDLPNVETEELVHANEPEDAKKGRKQGRKRAVPTLHVTKDSASETSDKGDALLNTKTTPPSSCKTPGTGFPSDIMDLL